MITSVKALGMFTNLCLVLPLLLGSPLGKKKLERNSENGQTLCKSADDVTALAQLRVLQPDNALVTPMIARVISVLYYDVKRGGSYKMFHYYKIPQSNDTVSHLRLHPNRQTLCLDIMFFYVGACLYDNPLGGLYQARIVTNR